MEPIREKRNQVMKRMRRRRKSMEQNDRGVRCIPGFAVEDPTPSTSAVLKYISPFLLRAAREQDPARRVFDLFLSAGPRSARGTGHKAADGEHPPPQLAFTFSGNP